MCGGPPGSQMKITEVSGSETADLPRPGCDGLSLAIAWRRKTSLRLKPPTPSAPIRKKLRRGTGPPQAKTRFFIEPAHSGPIGVQRALGRASPAGEEGARRQVRIICLRAPLAVNRRRRAADFPAWPKSP